MAVVTNQAGDAEVYLWFLGINDGLSLYYILDAGKLN